MASSYPKYKTTTHKISRGHGKKTPTGSFYQKRCSSVCEYVRVMVAEWKWVRFACVSDGGAGGLGRGGGPGGASVLAWALLSKWLYNGMAERIRMIAGVSMWVGLHECRMLPGSWRNINAACILKEHKHVNPNPTYTAESYFNSLFCSVI